MAEEEKVSVKVKDLSPDCKQVNVTAKVVSIGEAKEIPSRFGRPRKVAEATVGDETGTVVLSLWQEQIGSIVQDDVISIENGFVSLVRGKMRLNVGKYGKMQKVDTPIESVETGNDMSAKEYPQEERPFRRDSRGPYGGGGGGGGRDRDRMGGGHRDKRRLGF